MQQVSKKSSTVGFSLCTHVTIVLTDVSFAPKAAALMTKFTTVPTCCCQNQCTRPPNTPACGPTPPQVHPHPRGTSLVLAVLSMYPDSMPLPICFCALRFASCSISRQLYAPIACDEIVPCVIKLKERGLFLLCCPDDSVSVQWKNEREHT